MFFYSEAMITFVFSLCGSYKIDKDIFIGGGDGGKMKKIMNEFYQILILPVYRLLL